MNGADESGPMGELFEGYEAKRRQREAEIAERHRKEDVVDHELHELARHLDADVEFMKQNGITYDVVNRTLRIAHQRSPVVSVHYGADDGNYVVLSMRDGVQVTVKAAEECARTIGGTLFAVLAAK